MLDEEKIFYAPFEKLPDEMMRWAQNLHCLGQMVEALGFNQDETLTYQGEHIGDIIQDYAAALYNGLDVTSRGISDYVDQYNSPLHEKLSKNLKCIRTRPLFSPADFDRLESSIDEANEFMDKVEEISKLRAELLTIKEAWPTSKNSESPCVK